jgi:hypothetical protein
MYFWLHLFISQYHHTGSKAQNLRCVHDILKFVKENFNELRIYWRWYHKNARELLPISSSSVPRNLFLGGGGGGSTNSVEDRGQREGELGAVAP